MKPISEISYLSELYNSLGTPLNEIASGELNERGLARRYRLLARRLRQISETAAYLADTFEAEGNEPLQMAEPYEAAG